MMGGSRKVKVDLHWYDRDGVRLGVSQSTDARAVDIEQLGRHPVFQEAAYVSVHLRVEMPETSTQ